MSNLRLYLIKTEDLEKAIELNLITEDHIWTQGETGTELTLTKDQFENYSEHFAISLAY